MKICPRAHIFGLGSFWGQFHFLLWQISVPNFCLKMTENILIRTKKYGSWHFSNLLFLVPETYQSSSWQNRKVRTRLQALMHPFLSSGLREKQRLGEDFSEAPDRLSLTDPGPETPSRWSRSIRFSGFPVRWLWSFSAFLAPSLGSSATASARRDWPAWNRWVHHWQDYFWARKLHRARALELHQAFSLM